ncbi:hypothetical protein HU200_013005 [Digitaria exilis]|uniref:Uncharacterized protein n=1 Tax=Digitaria exilis TaxID=1010633 RepID=A0A835FDS7_9POAL|nr:hypothetical protein HU200_013005 [Digitaria exilis]
MQPKREGFPERQRLPANPSPSGRCRCRCRLQPKAASLFTSLPTTPHRTPSPRLVSLRLHFLAAYLSQSPRRLLDCIPHSSEPPPCRGSTARD